MVLNICPAQKRKCRILGAKISIMQGGFKKGMKEAGISPGGKG
jgi:hypothetical protein